MMTHSRSDTRRSTNGPREGTCGSSDSTVLPSGFIALNRVFLRSSSTGVSIAIKDMETPSTKDQLLDKAFGEVQEAEEQYSEGLITVGEKYNKVVDIWAKATDEATTIAERLQIINAQTDLMKAIATMQKYKDLGLVEDPMRNVTPAIKELPNE